MRVLVTAASKHGATQEIAEAIGRVLAEGGIEADVLKVDAVADLAGYDAVVLGSAVYMGTWLEEARRFVEVHSPELAALRTWIFSSGPIGDPPRPDPEQAVQLEEILARTGALEHRLFAGALDKSRLGFGERAVVLAFRAAEGDFRDWDEIRGWASEIADALRR
jgi:menaquinone-dependent protoporphyrinogen oxidase